jgi:hypothetical protein
VTVVDTNRKNSAKVWYDILHIGDDQGSRRKIVMKDTVRPRDLSYTDMLCVLVMLATSDTGVTNPRPEHHRQAGRN